MVQSGDSSMEIQEPHERLAVKGPSHFLSPIVILLLFSLVLHAALYCKITDRFQPLEVMVESYY